MVFVRCTWCIICSFNQKQSTVLKLMYQLLLVILFNHFILRLNTWLFIVSLFCKHYVLFLRSCNTPILTENEMPIGDSRWWSSYLP